MRRGEYLVYHFNAKTFVRCAPNGDALNGVNQVAYIFDDLADAQKYGHRKVQQSPALGCLIYDSDWKIADQILNAKQRGPAARFSPRWQLGLGVLLLVLGIALVWVDARYNWMLIIGFLVGARLAVGGIVRIVVAITNVRNKRADRAGG